MTRSPQAPAASPLRAPGEAARDRPDAYIPRDRRWALHAGHDLPDRVTGSALFADISGFTPLTEALANELGPQRGAEELTANIGRVFHAVIEELDAYDGNVIYFAGDAITCWIDGDDGSRACAAALGMQEAIQRTGSIVTPAGSIVQLAMKVAIAVGDARRFVVGDPDIQLIDVLAGRLMDDLAGAEHHAQKGEIVLDESAIAALGERVSLGDVRTDEETDRTCAVLAGLTVDVEPEPGYQPAPLPEDLVRPWLLPAVYERLRTGRGEFLAELRPAIPVFLRFAGIDYDNDDEAIHKLDDFVRAAQRVMNGFGGNVLQLTLGDKGAYLYGVFGSPIAHEDDAARAAAAALELRDLEKTTAAREIQIGITRGTLRSGTYGHAMRRTFVCLGDEVNLSARLMSAAPPQRIYVSERIRQGAGDAFIWEQLPAMKVKGKAEPVAVFALTGSLEKASRRRTRFELALVGRRRELAELEDRRVEAFGGRGRVVGIAADAGLGKSRLVAEFVRNVRRAGQTVAFGECQAYGTRTPYFVWREIWRRLFGLEDEDPVERQIAVLEQRLAAVDPGLVARAPLLSDVVGLSIPDSDLTRGFDAKLRKASLEDLLSVCLRARAREAPFAAVLEDCHWIDELSRDLLSVLVRSAASLPVLFVLAYRPAAEPGGELGITASPGFSELVLDRMEPDDIAELVRSKMAQLLGDDAEPGEPLVELVAARSEGNPFYVEELLSYIVAQGIDGSDPAALESVRLPESLHSLVLSRIDAAAEGPRRTMKVASVVGRVFSAPTLPGAYEELGSLEAVLDSLDALRALDLVALDREAEQAWMFKHIVTQEVAYESLPFALRALLHRLVGDYIERSEADDLDRFVPLLEHHYWRSDREGKKREYLRKAAEAAQASYANNAAIAYYDRLIPLLDGAEAVEERLKLAKVLQVAGELVRAEQVAGDARTRALEADDAIQAAWAAASIAETAKRQSRYDEATSWLEQAMAGFRAQGAERGVGDMLHLSGVIAQLTGDYATAQARYTEARGVRDRVGDLAGMATTEGNLAILAEFAGDNAKALAINDSSLELRRRIGDRRGIGIGEMNSGYYRILNGDLESAREHLEEALRLSLEMGDRAMIAHSTFTLGNVFRDLDEHAAAARQYVDAIHRQRDLDDRFSLTFILEDAGVLLARTGNPAAGLQLLGGAEAIRTQIGSPRPPSLEAELAEAYRPARGALGPEASAAAVDGGRAWSYEQAVHAAIAACSTVADAATGQAAD